MATSSVRRRRVRRNLSYTVERAAEALGVHPNTVRTWIREGLPVADRARPIILSGEEIQTFLDARRAARKRPSGPGRIYCFKCRIAVSPDGGMADLYPRNENVGTLNGLCPRCGLLIYRAVSMRAWHTAAGDLDVTIFDRPSTPKRDEGP